MEPVPKKIAKDLGKMGFSPAQTAQLAAYEALIRQWQKAINLISPSTLPQLWERHLLDSAQMWPALQGLGLPLKVVDLGSGGGLPGIVLGIADVEQITMVESDTRKGIFLRETAREIGLTNVTVRTERIEKTTALQAPIVTARALASLEQLAAWSEPLLAPGGAMVFMKGQDWQAELDALKGRYDYQVIDSITENKAKIIILRRK